MSRRPKKFAASSSFPLAHLLLTTYLIHNKAQDHATFFSAEQTPRPNTTELIYGNLNRPRRSGYRFHTTTYNQIPTYHQSPILTFFQLAESNRIEFKSLSCHLRQDGANQRGQGQYSRESHSCPHAHQGSGTEAGWHRREASRRFRRSTAGARGEFIRRIWQTAHT